MDNAETVAEVVEVVSDLSMVLVELDEVIADINVLMERLAESTKVLAELVD